MISTPRPALSRGWNLNLYTASGLYSLNCVDYALNMQAQLRPLLAAQNHYSDSSARKILLMMQDFVRRHKQVETGFLRRMEKIAIAQPIPSFLGGSANQVPLEEML